MFQCLAVVDAVIGTVIAAQDTADTVQIIEVFAAGDIDQPVDRAAEVEHDGIVAHGLQHEIGTCAADIADQTQIMPVLNDTHLTAHIAFFDHFIEDVYFVEAILRLCFIVDGIHDSDRTLFFNLGADLFIGYAAAGGFFLLLFFLGFRRFSGCGRCRFLFSGFFADGGFFCLRCVFGFIFRSGFCLFIRLFFTDFGRVRSHSRIAAAAG